MTHDSEHNISHDIVSSNNLSDIGALLNDLTTENLDSTSDQIILRVNHPERQTALHTLHEFARLVTEQATNDSTHAELYARLCARMKDQISSNVQDASLTNRQGTSYRGAELFRRYIWKHCRAEFNRVWDAKEAAVAAAKIKACEDLATSFEAASNDDDDSVLYSDEHYAAKIAKRRVFGLVIFIGKLFIVQVSSERNIHECVKTLLASVESPGADEDEIACLCELLTTTGRKADTRPARRFVDGYFTRLGGLRTSANLTPQVREMLQVRMFFDLQTFPILTCPGRR